MGLNYGVNNYHVVRVVLNEASLRAGLTVSSKPSVLCFSIFKSKRNY
jgi:hypothetical protein